MFIANKACLLLFGLAQMANEPFTKNGTHRG